MKNRGVDGGALSCINHSSGKSTMSETVMAQKVLSRTFQKTFALNLLQKILALRWIWPKKDRYENTYFSSDTRTVLKTDREQVTIDFSAAFTVRKVE